MKYFLIALAIASYAFASNDDYNDYVLTHPERQVLVVGAI